MSTWNDNRQPGFGTKHPSGRVHEWTVTNTTGGPVLFDDKSLEPNRSVSIPILTDDALNGWRSGKLRIDPDPQDHGHERFCVWLDPRQLPLPVYLVGNTTLRTEGTTVTEADPINWASGTRFPVAAADRRRRLLRIRNTSPYQIFLGGALVDDINGLIIIEPGETYSERDAPMAAWYLFAAISTVQPAATALVQHVYAGSV